MSEKQLRNVNDKLIKLLSRVDLQNARLSQIVNSLENLRLYIEERDKKIDREWQEENLFEYK